MKPMMRIWLRMRRRALNLLGDKQRSSRQSNSR